MGDIEVRELRTLLPAVEAAVREVGARLAEQRPAEPCPEFGLAGAMARFTGYDGPAAAELRARLGALHPEAGWVEDEFDGAAPTEGEWWLCDAMDGAVQFLLGLPQWAVTATLVRDGAAVLAVVHAPQLGARTYRAVRGGGAELDGRPIAPVERELAATVAGTSQPPAVAADPVALRRAGASLSAVAGAVLAVRNPGPTSLQVAQVGSGHLGLFWEFGTDAANLLPGALVAAEAGAAVTDAAGAAWTPAADGFLAAAPGLHRQALLLLKDLD
ncbi:inositol monophosphatase family protein [Streptomyces sp. NRRL S-495]|uniref:inositol monophosphatase family protein n=1 Tax=Streptomyces sp. NRRL S-495 TaxID=1609133 RepID=UPI0005F91E86|nr:inositol monophosphatase family protein [Streptomyces sp. NRRL S-495]KJY38516.1 inositol monophosphatase [Streptomyces sp. NRRL S-495]